METIRTYKELMQEAIDTINSNDDLFVAICEELDSWNGFLDDERLYDMYELNDLFYGISLTDFLDKFQNFFINHGGHDFAAGFNFEKSKLPFSKTARP